MDELRYLSGERIIDGAGDRDFSRILFCPAVLGGTQGQAQLVVLQQQFVAIAYAPDVTAAAKASLAMVYFPH